LILLSEKAVYLPDHRALLVSDVHLGKAETFQHYGIPIPAIVNGVTLERLTQLCDRTQATRLIILGDLFHARAGLVPEVLAGWRHFLQQTKIQADLLMGNHDRPLSASLEALDLTCWSSGMTLDRLTLSHEPLPSGKTVAPDGLNICGHIHPCVQLGQGRDRLRLSCFHWQSRSRCLTLPAFGEFTGGYTVRPEPGDIVYGIADGQVIDLSSGPVSGG
jgi:DNA ligase-associated metallophosphoesterase